MYSYGPLHMAEQRQGDQLTPTYLCWLHNKMMMIMEVTLLEAFLSSSDPRYKIVWSSSITVSMRTMILPHKINEGSTS